MKIIAILFFPVWLIGLVICLFIREMYFELWKLTNLLAEGLGMKCPQCGYDCNCPAGFGINPPLLVKK